MVFLCLLVIIIASGQRRLHSFPSVLRPVLDRGITRSLVRVTIDSHGVAKLQVLLRRRDHAHVIELRLAHHLLLHT